MLKDKQGTEVHIGKYLIAHKARLNGRLGAAYMCNGHVKCFKPLDVLIEEFETGPFIDIKVSNNNFEKTPDSLEG